MKAGANKTDQNAIKRMHEQGDDAEYISNRLQINIDTVNAFLPKEKETKGKGKSKLAEKFVS